MKRSINLLIFFKIFRMGSCSTKSKISTSIVVLQKQQTKVKETDETDEASYNSFPDPHRHTIFTRYLNAVPQ